MLCANSTAAEEGTTWAKATGPVQRVEVTGDGDGVTGQAGAHLLGELAARLGVAEEFSQVLAPTTQRSSTYDRGQVLCQVAMMLLAAAPFPLASPPNPA